MFGLLAFGGLALVVFAVSGPDYYSDEADYYFVDQSSVVNSVEEPCDTMRSEATHIRLIGQPRNTAADLRDFALTITGIIEAIDANDPNEDSRKWRADWNSLQNDLETYADNLAGQGAAAEYITSVGADELPIMLRMAYASDADCEVPAVIEALDTENAEYY